MKSPGFDYLPHNLPHNCVVGHVHLVDTTRSTGEPQISTHASPILIDGAQLRPARNRKARYGGCRTRPSTASSWSL